MTDRHLRALERHARETGAVADEARLLLARVRAGDLDPDRLALAASCGHEPARLAMPDAPSAVGDPAAWLASLSRFGRQPVVAAACAMARRWLIATSGLDQESEAHLAVAARFAHTPSQEHAQQALALYEAELEAGRGWSPLTHALWLAGEEAIADGKPGIDLEALELAFGKAAPHAAPTALVDELRAAVVAWALASPSS